MHQAEEDFDRLVEALRRQLAAHRWSGSCYRRFAPELLEVPLRHLLDEGNHTTRTMVRGP